MTTPQEHKLEIQTWQPLHAVCSCGLWSMVCVLQGFLTAEEALAEAEDAFARHLVDMERRQALSRILYPKGAPHGRKE